MNAPITSIQTQIDAIKMSIRDAQHEANQLEHEGDQYESGEMLQRVEFLRDAVKTLEIVKALKELMK